MLFIFPVILSLVGVRLSQFWSTNLCRKKMATKLLTTSSISLRHQDFVFARCTARHELSKCCSLCWCFVESTVCLMPTSLLKMLIDCLAQAEWSMRPQLHILCKGQCYRHLIAFLRVAESNLMEMCAAYGQASYILHDCRSLLWQACYSHQGSAGVSCMDSCSILMCHFIHVYLNWRAAICSMWSKRDLLLLYLWFLAAIFG